MLTPQLQANFELPRLTSGLTTPQKKRLGDFPGQGFRTLQRPATPIVITLANAVKAALINMAVARVSTRIWRQQKTKRMPKDSYAGKRQHKAHVKTFPTIDCEEPETAREYTPHSQAVAHEHYKLPIMFYTCQDIDSLRHRLLFGTLQHTNSTSLIIDPSWKEVQEVLGSPKALSNKMAAEWNEKQPICLVHLPKAFTGHLEDVLAFSIPVEPSRGDPESMLNCSNRIVWCAFHGSFTALLSCWQRKRNPSGKALICRAPGGTLLPGSKEHKAWYTHVTLAIGNSKIQYPDWWEKAMESLKLYCTCQEPSTDEMIACDSGRCRYEWFHFECVGIEKVPQGQWFCEECRACMGRKPQGES